MRSRSRVHDERLDVGHVGEQREHLQVVDELPCSLLAALNLEGEDRGTTVGEILLVELMVGVLRQARVVHLGDVAVTSQELNDLLGVLDMTVDAQRQGLGALEQDPGVKRANASALVTQQDGADIGREGGRAGSLGKRDAMVGGIGLGDLRILAARLPVKVAAIDNHAAQRGTVTANELGRGVDDDIGAMLQRTEQIRGAEGVIDNNRQAMLLGNLGDGVDVGDVGVGVAERLEIDDRGVVLNGTLDLVQVVGVDEGGLDTKLGERVLQQVVGTAVDGLLGDHVVTSLGKSLQGIGDGSGTGGDGKTGHATLERGNTVLEDALGGVGQTAVDVTGVGKTKAVGGVLGVAEHIARGLVDRHGTGIGCGIGALLANVKLQGVETKGMLGVVDKLAHDDLLDRTKVNTKERNKSLSPDHADGRKQEPGIRLGKQFICGPPFASRFRGRLNYLPPLCVLNSTSIVSLGQSLKSANLLSVF